MKVLMNIILVILVFLAIASGVSKMMLMQQEVEFFGQYGFSDFILVIFGVIQLLGGIFLIFQKTRVIGAIMVAITFLVSLIMLLMAGNVVMAVITFVCVMLLGLVLKPSYKTRH